MPNEHRADPSPPPHHGQGRGGSKKESFSLRVSPALHPPERPSPRRADMADHGPWSGDVGTIYYLTLFDAILFDFSFADKNIPNIARYYTSYEYLPFEYE